MFNFARMTMQRQLWLAILLSILLALSGALVASLHSARSYLGSQLSIKNTDNANALALALSQQNPDLVMVQLLVSSLADSGHYELVRISDPQGQTLAQSQDLAHAVDAPAWFARLLPITSEPGVAQISSGWKQFGQVTLVSHSRFAYGALWESAQYMAMVVSLAGALGLMLATLILRRLESQLDMLTQQAQDIGDRRFAAMPEPQVPELKSIAKAMNLMVGKLKASFDEQGAMLESIRLKANNDEPTGLANRGYFLGQLETTLSATDAAGGTLLIARLANLQNINVRLGRLATDQLLAQYALVIRQEAARWPDALAGRLNGSEFALLIPGKPVELDAFESLYHQLVAAVAPSLPGMTSTWLAGASFDPGASQSSLLAQIDAVLAKLESTQQNGWQWLELSAHHHQPLSNAQWTQTFEAALKQGRLKIDEFAVRAFQGALIHSESALRMKFVPDGAWEVAGKFWPMVERLGLSAKLDLAAVRLGLARLTQSPDIPGMAINLSGHSIAQPAFCQALLDMLQANPATPRLWLEVSESTATRDFKALLSLSEQLKPLSCKLGIEHFGKRFEEIGRLQQLGLDYLKIDAAFVRDIHHNTGNQTFLKGLLWIAHSMGMRVYSAGVNQAEEYDTLRELGFDGAFGPYVQ